MAWFRNLSLTVKMMLLSTVLLIVCVVLGIFASAQMARVNMTSTEIANNWLPSTQLVGQMQADLEALRCLQYQHVVTTDAAGMHQVEGQIARRHDSLVGASGDYEKMISSDRERALFDKVHAALRGFDDIEKQLLDLSRTNNQEGAVAYILSTVAPASEVAAAAIQELVEFNVDMGGEASARGDELYASARTSLMAVIAVAVLAGLGLSFWIAKGITEPIKRAVARLQASENDLSFQLEVNSRDEIGVLLDWVNKFVASLHDVVVEVRQSSEVVAAAATEIAASSEQIAASSRHQESQVGQVSSAVEEMSASVAEVAQKSADAAKGASGAGEVAGEGQGIVQETIERMNGIAEAVNAGSEAVGLLGKRSEEIGAITNIINDIADQTNLLALNAAIEAARAGEHGRGFAVVADEVRKLADRTTEATQQIAQAIRAMQDDTKGAVERMASGTSQVEVGVVKARTAGDSLESIARSSGDVAQMIGSIATAAIQQSSAAEEITRSIVSISEACQQATSGADQAAQAASSLSEKAEHLSNLVARFKLKR